MEIELEYRIDISESIGTNKTCRLHGVLSFITGTFSE